MPRTASATKRARQSKDRNKRLQPVKTIMKTSIRKMSDAAKTGKKDEVAKLLPLAYKAIYMAAKKNLIHPRNAARKKAAMAKLAN